MSRYKMDMTVYFFEIVVIFFLSQGYSGETALNVTSVVFNATGVNSGLSVQVEFSGSPTITCLIDSSLRSGGDEEEVDIIEISESDPSPLETNVRINGYYNLYILVVDDDEFDTETQTDYYLGDAITAIDISNNANGFIIPVISPVTADVNYAVYFLTGTDVNITFTLLNSSWTFQEPFVSNETQTILINRSNFPTSGLYTLVVNLTSPLHTSGIVKYSVLAVQEPLDVTSVSLQGYSTDIDPIHVMVGQEFQVAVQLLAGDSLTFTLTVEQDNTTIDLTGNHCTGKITSNELNYTFTSTGSYNLTVDISNYVSNYTETIAVEVIYEVNYLTVDVTPIPVVLLSTETVTYTVTVADTANLPMGNVTCNVESDNGHTTGSMEFDMSASDYASLSKTTDIVEARYVEGWYEITVNCSNQLPYEVNSIKTYYSFKQLVKVVNPIVALMLIHDSPDPFHHGFSKPITFTVHLTTPATDLPNANLTCEFNTDSSGVGDIKSVTGDVTSSSNITYTKTFNGGKNYTVSVNCSNLMDDEVLTLTDTFRIYFDCWGAEQYFSNIYQTHTGALVAKTNEAKQIKADVILTGNCNGTLKHHFTLYKVDNITETFDRNLTSSSATSLNIPKFDIPHGLYKLKLTTYFTGIDPTPVLSDFIYLNYTLPPLIPSLAVDGSFNAMKTIITTAEVVINSSQSSDPGFPNSVQLNRQWNCKTGVSLSEADVLAFMSQEDISDFPDNANAACLFSIVPDAVQFTIPPNTLSTQWYILTLTITDDNIPPSRRSTKAQAILGADQEPLTLELQCISNCYPGSSNIDTIILKDLQLNVKVETPGLQNKSMGYQWAFKASKADSSYDDKTENINDTSKIGVKISKELLTEMIGNNYTKFIVSCTVTAQNFALTTVSQIYKMNLPPYNGTCAWSGTNETVTASVTEVCFECMFWVDEGEKSERDISDTGGTVQYAGVQLYLNEENEVNNSHGATEHPYSANPKQCFKLLKSPVEAVTKTRVQARIRDIYQLPYASVILPDLVIEPAVPKNASGEAGVKKIEAMLESNSKTMENALKTNDIEGTAAAILIMADALPEGPEGKEAIAPEENEPDTGGLIIATDEDGEPISANKAIGSLAKQEVDPVLTKCKEAMVDFVDALLNTSTSQSEETKRNPVSQLQVANAVAGVAKGKKHLNESSLSTMKDIVTGIFVNTEEVDSGSPDGENFLKGAINMMAVVASAMAPSDLAGVQKDASLAAERARSEAEALFANEDTQKQVEEGKLSPAEMQFIKSVLAKRQKESVKKRQDLCNEYSKKKTAYQMNIVRNAKISDGSDNSIGAGDARADMTRDTGENLANKTVQSATSSANYPGLATGGYKKTTVAIFHQSSVSRIDNSDYAGAISSGESTLVIDTEGELPKGRVKLTHKIGQVSLQPVELFNNEDDASKFTYFLVNVKTTFDDLNFNIKPDPESGLLAEKFRIYILYIEYIDQMETLFVSKTTFTYTKECDASNCVVQFKPEERGPNAGVYKVGIETIHKEDSNSTARRKRSAFLTKNETIQFGTATMACMTWDDSTDSWRSDECEGTWKPDTGELDCECKPKKALTFANSFYVAPNKIDFSSVFLKFSPLNQAAVMATLILILLIYIIIVIWTRRQDRKDLLRWGITPLSDNFSEDNYFYVIKVFTGMRPGAGTRSRICMVICGEEMDSGVRELYDGVRDEFSTGSVMNFLMSTTVYLGDLDYIRIWHDNSGGGSYASWYLSRMEVHDVQRNESFSFLGERWLAVEKEDGLLECVLPVCKSENLNVFKNRFFMNAKDNLADSHIWISVAYRPQASNFTRTQRASCALLFVMLTMIANAMFFKGSNEDNYETPAELQVGPFRFSLQQIYISFVCALIVTPGTLLVIYLFKLSKVKLDPNATVFQANDKSSRYKIPFMNNWLENEQKRSVELEKHLVQKGLPNNQGFALPHWCRNLAWFIVLVTSFICAFFIMLFSMEWGKQKSEEWIATFLLSFFESVFCLDPVKVGIMALVVALICRSTKDLQAPVNRSTIMKRYSSNLRGKSKGLRLPAPPLDQKKLEKAREEKQRDVLMKRAMRDIITNIVIIWILFSISYSNRDTRSFYMHKEVVNTLLEPINKPSFSSIRTTEDFFDWLNNTAIINAFPEYEKDADSTPLHWRVRQFTEGGSHFRVGPPRLRQVRTTKESCTNSPFPTEDCFKRYYEPTEETKSYCIGWKAGSCDPDEELYKYSSDAWKFTSAFDIWGMPISGYYTTYGGGGYISKLSVNRKVSLDILDELYQNSWVDRQTRAVLFEFTLYCLNANIFTYNMFMVEFPETGGAMPYYIIFPMRVYLHQGPLGIYTLACEVLFVLYVIILTVMMIVQFVRQKKDFFKKGWQIYDLVFIILAYVAMVMNIVQVVFTNMSLDVFREDKKAFVNFYHLAIWNTILVLLIGLLVFMATLRMLNILGYNKRIGAVAKVFTKAASDLLWFGLFFSYVFTCYAAFGFLLFGWKLKSYKNVFKTMGTLFISMIGKSRFTEIEETDPVFSKVYFMCFIFFVVYMILTMFLAVLSKAIDQVHQDTKRDRSEEMVDYVIKKMRGLMTYGGTAKKGSVKPAPWNREPSAWSHKHRAGQFTKATNREILQEIRETMNEALTVDPRDFKTPDVEHSKRKVKFRR
ncbi:uncharacterized protein LOC123565009 [Mercenaria mercenaria]|uniref:uncharacterized protein LOC123565009 n=1 Tax=Mercenaria mercenaria TaxID=6596 RepID=UPI00234ED636|nr:uncharacterized protein LOC123565009 [Mercenaria mercenaria]